MVTCIFAYKSGQYNEDGLLSFHSLWNIQNVRPNIVDALSKLIFRSQ